MQIQLPKWIICKLREEFPSSSIQHTIKVIIKECLDTEEGRGIINGIIERNREGRGIKDKKYENNEESSL